MSSSKGETIRIQRTAAIGMNTAGTETLDIAMPRVGAGFREPRDLRTTLGDDPLLLDLVATSAFRRLREIRFLGAIDYRRVPRPNGQPGSTRYTRYQHSLGVTRLARLYCTDRSLDPVDRRMVCAAALLHDIGHPPLSHSMEPVFKEKFGIEHHGATESIICGRVPFGKEVFSKLRLHGVDVEKLISVISGDHSDFDGFFGGPINFDTIEGILRSCAYILRSSSIPGPETVTTAAVRRKNRDDRDTVDAFWNQKDWVYKNIINSREGVLADFACRVFMRRNIERIDRDCFFTTEGEIFRKTPGLRELLTSATFESEVVRIVDEPVRYRERCYYVDADGDFFGRRDDVRYRHSRVERALPPEKAAALATDDNAKWWQGALFDDDTV